MKATELMIGDWVEWKPQKGGFIGIVGGDRALTPEFIKVKASHLNSILNDYYPIPLTPEILEKNGWWQDEIDGTYHNTMNVYGRKAPFSIFDGVIINYVHELQHALRLCGLEEMANKFEI